MLPEFLGTHLAGPAGLFGHPRATGSAHQPRPGRERWSQLQPRTVRIDRLELLDYLPPDVRLRISCSKGTYIRSLARDIAARLGTCAHVSRLRRTRIGGFSVDDARSPDAFDPGRDVLPPEFFFESAPALGMTGGDAAVGRCPSARGYGWNRSSSTTPPVGEGIFGAFSRDQRLLAVIERSERRHEVPAARSPIAGESGAAAMTVLAWSDLLERRPPLDRPVRLTIGVFDGVHVGHRRLLAEITAGPRGYCFPW